MTSWDLQHDVPLALYTTFEVGGLAQYFVSVTDCTWLPGLIRWAQDRKLPVAVLGGGSNLVVSNHGVQGLVLHLAPPPGPPDIVVAPASDVTATLSVAAAVAWDTLVAASCAAGAFDLACLSGIPGACGAAPVQNIGAYGQSLADTLVAVEGVCLATGQSQTWAAAELGLGYRTSYFKTVWQNRYVVTRLHVHLETQQAFVPAYAQLTEALAAEAAPGGQAVTPDLVRRTVLGLRRQKSMIWTPDDDNRRSAGSFFTNPIVRTGHAQKLCRRYPSMPSWPQGAYTKLSAAWLIEQAGFAKGFAQGQVGLSSRHALAVINRGGAQAQAIVELARAIQASVLACFGVGLAVEPSFWGFGPSHPLPAAAHNEQGSVFEGGA